MDYKARASSGRVMVHVATDPHRTALLVLTPQEAERLSGRLRRAAQRAYLGTRKEQGCPSK